MIRAARASDAAGLAALWNPWIKDTAITFNPLPKSAADLEAMIAAREANGHGFLVAEDQGILGFATYGQFRAGLGYGRTMEHTIILGSQARGRGLGAALLTALEAHARTQGAHQMIAGVSAENPAGLQFHARQGYVETARIREAGWKFGRFIDLILMQKFL